jgi:RES domain-containing protein
VWRHIPAGSFPLNFAYIIRARGRWNRPRVYGCLYTSLSRDGAIAEYRKLRASAAGGTRLRRHELVSIDVHHVEPLLDLSDPAELGRFGVDSPEHILADTEASLELCRMISDEARRAGAVGLLAPSAALREAVSLMIYHDGLAAGIDLDVGPDREPMPD